MKLKMLCKMIKKRFRQDIPHHAKKEGRERDRDQLSRIIAYLIHVEGQQNNKMFQIH